MSLVRAIESTMHIGGPGAGVRLGTSRVRWAIESAVATVFEVGIEELRALSLTEVGRLFERDRTTVAHACGLIEDKRDEPDFDYRLDHLERAVSCLVDAPGAPMSRVARGPQSEAAAARRLLKGLSGEAAALLRRRAAMCFSVRRELRAKQSECRNAWWNFA